MKRLSILFLVLGIIESIVPAFPATGRKVLTDAIVPTFTGGTAGQPGQITRQVLTAGELAASQPVQFSLKMRNYAELQARVQGGEVLSADELVNRYCPTHEAWAKVAEWARTQGLSVNAEDRSRMTVFAAGSVDRIQRALQVTFARVLGTDGKEYTSAVTAPSIPEELSGLVSNVRKLQPHLRPVHHVTVAPIEISAYLSPVTVAQLYSASGIGWDGTGQTIVICGEGPVSTSDLTAFWQNCGLSTTLSQFKEIDPNGPPLADEASAEETMDIEWASAMAPKAQIVYFSSTDAAAFQAWLLSQTTYSSVCQATSSYSYFFGTTLPDTQYYAAMAAVGLTYFNATGDYGSTGSASGSSSVTYNVNGTTGTGYPSSDPYVTAVGGTVLYSQGTSVTEGGWCLPNGKPLSADTGYSASTGGVSTLTRPSWQTGTGLPSGSLRFVPDVAAMAYGNLLGYIYYKGQAGGGGGTSQSAPIWSGLCALINQARTGNGLSPVGLLGPKIYPLNGTSAFNQMTTGAYDGTDGFSTTAKNGLYAVGANYNMVTGLGSPNVSALISSLGSASGGTAPVISSQPASQTVAQAGAAVFTVSASGSPSPSIVWIVGGESVVDGTQSDGSVVAGSAAGSLRISNAGTTTTVEAIASNANGVAVSNIVALTISGSISLSDSVVTTLAGSRASGATDGTGTVARFSAPGDAVADASDNLYIADCGNNLIRKVTPAGVVTTLAGSGAAGSADGTGTAASFNFPTGVAVDSSGNVYVADTGNNEIRKITSAGVVTTLAGSTTSGSADGTGGSASFSWPTGPALDSSGNIYVADASNNEIRKVSGSGVVTTFAGSTTSGSRNGTGTAARFYSPAGVAVDSSGNIYVADAGNGEIRKITSAGVVTTFAGNPSYTGSVDGAGTAATFSTPADLAVDSSGNVYVSDAGNNSIRKITPAGVVTTLAGSVIPGAVDGSSTVATFNNPEGLAVDSAGNVYVADQYNNSIRKISTVVASAPVITWPALDPIVYGTALSSTQLDATASVSGTFAYSPSAGTILGVGTQTLSVTFTPNDTVNYTTATATQSLVVAALPAPVAGAAGDVIANRFTATWSPVTGATGYRIDVSTSSSFSNFVSGYQSLNVGNVTSVNVTGLSAGTTYYYRIEAYDSAGNGIDSSTISVTTTPAIVISTPLTVSTLAGQALTLGSADGTGSAARFYYPSGIVATDSSGNVYVADTDNDTIRKVVPSTGVVTTLAGAPGLAGSADGTGSNARFHSPSGVAVDSSGNVYVADTLNNTIRLVSPAGVVSTLAGSSSAGSSDGTGTGARFYGPQGLAADSSNNIYVADTNNQTVRKLVPSTGVVTTIAGGAGLAGRADGSGTGARFNFPSGVAADTSGNVYVADTENNLIRSISSAGVVSTVAGQAGFSGGADGTGTAATFDGPSAVAVDSSGNIYVADTGNFTIRIVVASTKATTTLAGVAGTSGSSDGTGSAALFFQPAGLSADNSGNLYIADTNNHTIRLGLLQQAPKIETQPQSQTVTAGSSVQFSVTATGRPTPTYQWYFGGTAISGATGSSYSITSAQSANAGSYTVTVTNSMGSVTSSAATLTVNAATTTTTGSDSSSGGGGGGGAPGWWFCGSLLLLSLVRQAVRRRK